MTQNKDQIKEMTKIAYDAIDEKLGHDIQILDISNISVITDYFLIAHGTNVNQVQAIIDNVEDNMAKAGYKPSQIEGYHTADWILLDYNDIIIHVFKEDMRSFYDLERIWRDGIKVNPSSL